MIGICEGDLYYGYEDRCFVVFGDTAGWNKAASDCEAIEGNLAKIDSLELALELRTWLNGRYKAIMVIDTR